MSGISRAPTFPLAMSSKGDMVEIVSIQGGAALALRVAELGLNVGSTITVCQHQGGGLVVARGATRLALGAGMAHKILVTPTTAQP